MTSLSAVHLSDPADIEGFLKELESESDRAAVLIGVGYAAQILKLLIEYRFIDLADDETAALFFEARGPLSDLASRINLAYALGLITREVKSDLDRIRRIRNAFAHTSLPLTLEHPIVAKECRALISANNPPPEVGTRKVYELAIFTIIVSLLRTDQHEDRKWSRRRAYALRKTRQPSHDKP